MKRLHKAAAVLFAAAILCSFSVFASAAEDDWGDEWETEEISATELQESSQQSYEESNNSSSDNSAAQDISGAALPDENTVGTGDDSAAGILALAGAAAVSVGVVGIFAGRRKRTE